MSFETSVIISTYNQPEWLRKVLIGYEQQSIKNLEIIIADDGSTKETEAVVKQFKASSNLVVTHVWQNDKGFRKTKILNKAIRSNSVVDFYCFIPIIKIWLSGTRTITSPFSRKF